MESGRHSLTLGRLYAWEKKLFDEVKAGDELRKIYDCKFSQLRNKESRGDVSEDKTTADLRDLYSRISVTLTTADLISKRVQKLRDEELQLQLVELLHGLTRTWKIMSEVHQSQNKTMSEVKSFTCPALGSSVMILIVLPLFNLKQHFKTGELVLLDMLLLKKHILKLLMDGCPCSELQKMNLTLVIYQSHIAKSMRHNLSICHDRLASMEKLPFEAVAYAMKSFGNDIRALCFQQGVEQQQKRKLDCLARELDKPVVAFKKAEKKILETKLFEQKVELDMFRNRLDAENSKHHDSIQETQKVILNGFQSGFSSVLDSMSYFSKASLKMYTELWTHGKLLS